MDNKLKEFSVKDLLESDNYLIPIYQRNYAWTVENMQQLLRDVADYLIDNKDCNYYIGNLIVFPKRDSSDYSKTIYETVDGQQRLTTLNIIMSALHNIISSSILDWYKGVNIRFDNREISNITLSAIYSNQISPNSNEDYNNDILNVYNKVSQSLDSVCNESGITVDDFLDYFLNKVIILRISVPEDTDLNHYFEIMNSRGEQLEQHEVLKANLMDVIKDSKEKMYVFDKIWESCSNLDKYIQMNFNPNERDLLFGSEWKDFPAKDFSTIYNNIISCKGNNDSEDKTLEQLFEDNKNHAPFIDPNSASKEDEAPDRFHSLINFPNLLLHVLSITNPNCDVPLDDKRLSKTFEDVLQSQNDKVDFVENFITNLLYIRTLFDSFIIKTRIEDNNEKWSLKKIKAYNGKSKKPQYDSLFSYDDENDQGDNNQVILLLSMFHVSSPTMNYKYWMNASLNFVYSNNGSVTASDYINFLESLSKTYLLDRFLVNDKREYADFIHDANCSPLNSCSDIDWNLLNKGVGVENFIFNCYDYILWLKNKSRFSNFYYSYRNSVEHFYPQHPIGNFPLMEENHLNNFGNLCILNRNINSKFSNSIPKAKIDNFGSSQERATYSIKLQLMMEHVDKTRNWDIPEIEKFFDKAKTDIEDYLS